MIEIKQQSRVIKHYFFYLFIHDAHQILLWWWTQNTQDVIQLIQVCEHNACQGQEMFINYVGLKDLHCNIYQPLTGKAILLICWHQCTSCNWFLSHVTEQNIYIHLTVEGNKLIYCMAWKSWGKSNILIGIFLTRILLHRLCIFHFPKPANSRQAWPKCHIINYFLT